MLISYFHSIRNSRERNFLLFPSVRVSPFKLPSRGKTKRIQSNVLSFIFIRLHPSTSLSVSRWNKILSLSPSTPQIFSFSVIAIPPHPLFSSLSSLILKFFLFVYFHFVLSNKKTRVHFIIAEYPFGILSFLQRNGCSILSVIK